MKVYNNQVPQHTVAIKLDGIQVMLNNDGVVVSRAGKPVYNINPELLEQGKKYECFIDDFNTTVSILRSPLSKRAVYKEHLYEIYPNTDKRLICDIAFNVGSVKRKFAWALKVGYEGLVIDQKYKLKQKLTYDVPITGIILSQQGQYKGMLGALETPMGKVGTGFTKEMRQQMWCIGDLIEVECMEVTKDGKFRHPRFVRLRWDKENV